MTQKTVIVLKRYTPLNEVFETTYKPAKDSNRDTPRNCKKKQTMGQHTNSWTLHITRTVQLNPTSLPSIHSKIHFLRGRRNHLDKFLWLSLIDWISRESRKERGARGTVTLRYTHTPHTHRVTQGSVERGVGKMGKTSVWFSDSGQ